MSLVIYERPYPCLIICMAATSTTEHEIARRLEIEPEDVIGWCNGTKQPTLPEAQAVVDMLRDRMTVDAVFALAA